MGAGPTGDAEELIGRALRAQVGGSARTAAAPEDRSRGRFTTAQVLLIAAIVGVLVGMGAGLAILLG